MMTTFFHEPLDDAQFTLGMTRVTPSLRSYARSLSGDRELALDLTQDTLLRAWAARARFIPGSNMKAWLFRILRNAFLSHLRRRRNARTETYGDDLPELPVPPSQEARVEMREVAAAWRHLSSDHQAALQMIGIDGLSYETAAALKDISVGTLKSRVWRARTALRHGVEGGALNDPRRMNDAIESRVDTIDHDKREEIDRKQIEVLQRWLRDTGRIRQRG